MRHLLFTGVLASRAISAATNASLISDTLSDTILNGLQKYNITGVEVAVTRNGTTQLKAWGNKTELGEPLTPETLMNIGSCSKAFLAAAMGILIDDFELKQNVTALPPGLGGKLQWTTKVSELIPEFRLSDKWATEKANIQDLLSHVTGLPRHDLSYAPTDTPAKAASRMRYLSPAFELRQQWSYNNQMYMVGSYIISKYSNRPFGQFVEERIFKPAGMAQSTYSPSAAAKTGNLSDSFNAVNRRIPQWITETSAPLIAGPGGVMSSAADMLNWVQLLLNDGVLADSNTTVIPRSAFTAIMKPYTIVDAASAQSTYAMGWVKTFYQNRELILHDGGIPGGSSLVGILPGDDPIGVIVLISGSDKGDYTSYIWSNIVDGLLGVMSPDGDNITNNTSSMMKRDNIVGRTQVRNRLQITTSAQLDTQARLAHLSNRVDINGSGALEELAGTYHNAGYGANFTLCTATTPSPNCVAVVSDFKTVDGDIKFNATSVTLYASWPRFWSSHLRLGALGDFDGVAGTGTFGFEPTNLYPSGYGADSSPFEDLVLGQAVASFSVDASGNRGLGVFGIRGVAADSEPDVWFERV